VQSEQDAREYAQRLRAAPVEELVSELMVTLLSAAQMKLGRRDARLLIDLAGLMADHARPYVSADLAKNVDDSIGQLRFGQVTAEREVAKSPEAEPNDLAVLPTPPAASPPAPPPPATSKLWVPGQ
jgi:hypothetical protein